MDGRPAWAHPEMPPEVIAAMQEQMRTWNAEFAERTAKIERMHRNDPELTQVSLSFAWLPEAIESVVQFVPNTHVKVFSINVAASFTNTEDTSIVPYMAVVLRFNDVLSHLRMYVHEDQPVSLQPLREAMEVNTRLVECILHPVSKLEADPENADMIESHLRENGNVQEHCLAAMSISDGMLPFMLAKTNRSAMVYKILREHVNVAISGWQAGVQK